MSRALRTPGTVLVDLSGLAFADPSLMLDLAMLARRLRAAGGHILIRGAEPHIQRLIDLVGLHRLAGVQVERAPAPA